MANEVLHEWHACQRGSRAPAAAMPQWHRPVTLCYSGRDPTISDRSSLDVSPRRKSRTMICETCRSKNPRHSTARPHVLPTSGTKLKRKAKSPKKGAKSTPRWRAERGGWPLSIGTVLLVVIGAKQTLRHTEEKASNHRNHIGITGCRSNAK